jgi:hypothetical protein
MINFLNFELTCNDQVFFEILKMKIRSISISHSITKTREEKDLILIIFVFFISENISSDTGK